MPDLTPVFICGTARSGTTLLLRMLDDHPSLAVVPWETYGYRHLATTLPSRLVMHLADVWGWRALPAALCTQPLKAIAFRPAAQLRRDMTEWLGELPDIDGKNAEAVAGAFRAASSPDRFWQALLPILNLRGAVRTDRRRYWVEKTPQNERFVPLAERMYGGRVRYLHIVRDPRDVVASWLKRVQPSGSRRTTGVIDWCVNWSRAVEWSRHNFRACAGRYYLLRYEDLVRRPADVMCDVCTFLDIPPSERVLLPTRMGQPVGRNTSYEYVPDQGTVFSSQVGRYPTVLRPDELEVIEQVLGSQMASLGYTTPGGSPRRIETMAARLWWRHPKAALKVVYLGHLQRSYRDLRLPLMSS